MDESIRFYSALFGESPSKQKDDYAKWMLEDPHVNFAISTRVASQGLDHMGIQVDHPTELEALRNQMSEANISTHSDGETTCCYAKSEKSWVQDPNGLAWEAYQTMEDVQIFSENSQTSEPDSQKTDACCTPSPEKQGCC